MTVVLTSNWHEKSKTRRSVGEFYCIPFENIALLRAHFILKTEGADGSQVQIQGHTSEIVRKQQDGSWLYIVDHPFGADLLKEADSAGKASTR